MDNHSKVFQSQKSLDIYHACNNVAGDLAYASTFRVEESKFVGVHILYCRIIVGAPMGTFPGGLPLTDPGQSAENQTGLVYSCPVQPGVCEGVQGDTSITAQDIDANMDPNINQLPTSGPVIEGRLFDQARKNICMFVPVIGTIY